MKKGIMLLADGFELCEAMITLDLLRRSKIELYTISMMETKSVFSQSNVMVEADKLYDEIKNQEYDFLILPGGGAIFKNHLTNNNTLELVKKYNEEHKLIAAICAAPKVLGKLGLLKNKTFTCFPSCEEGIDGKYLKNKKVVKEDNIITSKAMGTTFEFAEAIIRELLGKEISKQVLDSVYYD